jgi:LysM repeat protein
MRKWVGFLLASVLTIVLLGVTGCEKSKLPPAPTLELTSQVVGDTTPTPTVAVGETVISVEPTETPPPDASPTPIPTMTPTLEPGAPTNTPAPTATTEAGETPEPAGDAEFEYTVQTGDTLWGLALRFGTTVEAIRTRNSLTSDIIYKGDKLIIPGTADGETVTHVVQPGENLFRISLKYGTTVEAIAARNGIINPGLVYVGQELVIPQGGGSPGTGGRYHVVQPGETLWSIAMKYGTTPWKIAAANGIANINWIYAGRTLRIP